ncbi:MAG: orotidine-5'-phosphate decarboxylase [Flavobacteriales bacterium]|jgi:orotidine-5'-phosphate decarboxylase
MTRTELISRIRSRKSFLCVGLDTDPAKLPAGADMLTFNKAIIDATREHCVAYKPNLAFYEVLGAEGWRILEETIRYMGRDHFIIADAKRGDIGNTSSYYARTFFDTLGCDSVTVAPYMGRDSIEPFLQFQDKWAIVLALTSNPGADDFELREMEGEPAFAQVLRSVSAWGSPDNTMFVVGATRPEQLARVRSIVPRHFLLVPGVGAQGGSLAEVVKYGMNEDVGLLINASRSILYASSGADYAEAAGKEALRMKEEMSIWL